MDRWTFLTNHGHVFLCLAEEPLLRLRDLAAKLGVTERTAQRAVADLAAAGYVTSERIGRRNRYSVHGELPLRHANEKDILAQALLGLRGRGARSQMPGARRRRGEKNERIAKSSSSTRSKREMK